MPNDRRHKRHFTDRRPPTRHTITRLTWALVDAASHNAALIPMIADLRRAIWREFYHAGPVAAMRVWHKSKLYAILESMNDRR